MGRKVIQAEIHLKEGQKLGAIKLSDSEVERLGINKIKPSWKYIEEYINDRKKSDEIAKEIELLMLNALPKDIKKNCEFCQKKNVESNPENKACSIYQIQMRITIELAISEFVRLVEKNKMYFQDKNRLRILTGKFIQQFRFPLHKGVVWFDYKEFVNILLNMGLLSVLENLKKHDILSGLQLVNNALEDLEEKQLLNKIDRKFYPFWYTKQIEFHSKQREILRAKLLLEEATNKQKPKRENENPTKLHIALFAYYAEKEGYKLYPELSFPSVKYWEKIASSFGRHFKQIQLHYNNIQKPENRLVLDKEKYIRYVAEEMLNDYPKAKSLALSELKQIRLK